MAKRCGCDRGKFTMPLNLVLNSGRADAVGNCGSALEVG
jgi:hypothetical protein